MPNNPLRYHQSGAVLDFRVDGRATMQHSSPIRRLAEQALAHGVTCLHVDLRHCTYMDSTFVGTLLILQKTVKGKGTMSVVCPSPQCQRVMQTMGLLGQIPVDSTDELPTECWCDADAAAADRDAMKYNVYDSHQELVNVGGPTAEPFRAVVATLKKELEASR